MDQAEKRLRQGKDFGDYQHKLGEFESFNLLVEILRSLNYQSQRKEEDDDTNADPTNDKTVRGERNPESFFATRGEAYTADLDKPAAGPSY
jgi:hypothetical protein